MAENMVNLAQTTYHNTMGAQRTDQEIRKLNVAQTQPQGVKHHKQPGNKKRISLFMKSNYSKSKGIAGNQ